MSSTQNKQPESLATAATPTATPTPTPTTCGKKLTHQLVKAIKAREFDFVMRKFREFFAKKGMLESATQATVDILSACEDTQNLGSFKFVDGRIYPLKQTGQMVLEDELLADPTAKGFFCMTTSHRFEKNPNPARHDVVFPMMEYEIPGDLNTLLRFHRELLEHFGFGLADSFPEVDYLDVCKRYGVTELTHEHETRMLADYGPVVFLKNFPEATSPFWNMMRVEQKDGTCLAKKCDVIMNGIETIGSAERSCDVADMRKRFYSIMDGKYSQALFDLFGKPETEQELDRFFQHKFIQRSGAGIGVTRMIKACLAANLI
jgi:aspartyl/asparaginyl-tRNA synthetase